MDASLTGLGSFSTRVAASVDNETSPTVLVLGTPRVA
jgi:hypothetical protein